jgi:hypothetical protein
MYIFRDFIANPIVCIIDLRRWKILIKAFYMAVLRKALNIAVRVPFRSGSLDEHMDWWERPTHDNEWVRC